MSAEIGLLLINLGTPASPDDADVKRYLKQFLLDKYVIDYPWLFRQLLVRAVIVPKRYKNSAASYRKIWDKDKGSPLMYYGTSLAHKVQHLAVGKYEVALAMRYQEPSIPHAIETLLQKKVKKIIVFPLYPQYSSSCTETAFVAVDKCIKKIAPNIPVTKILDYYAHPAYISALCDEICKFDLQAFDHILFSYHGVPVRHIRKGDPSGHHCMELPQCCEVITEINRRCYKAHCMHTTKAIVAQLGLSEDRYSNCFQSRLGKEEWIQPYTAEVLERLARQGTKRILTVCPAFTADCLETLYEIAEEYKHEFQSFGGDTLEKVSCVNDSNAWANGILQIIEDNTN